MGKKHWENRKELKKTERRLKLQGWKENELGELKYTPSKAEVRAHFVHRVSMFLMAERTILPKIQKEAMDEICAAMDEEFLR